MDTTPVLTREHATLKSFRIFVGTWNLNAKNGSVPLGEYWLACDPNPPDIYAIGFQELDVTKEALKNDNPREEELIQASVHSLHPNAEYVKVKSIRFVGVMLVVFIKKELEAFVTNIATETVRMNQPRGGVAVRFDFHSTSLCFINCHLAPHVGECEHRNEEFHDICNRMVFTQLNPPKLIKDHRQIYWFGDLNYRLKDLTSEQARKLLEENEYSRVICEHDELVIQQKAGKAFAGFSEGDIRFKPTYKYDNGTDNWDSSEKNRPPAWCDRILWKGGPTKLLLYRSHPKLMISDHKPVSALFDASIKVVDT